MYPFRQRSNFRQSFHLFFLGLTGLFLLAACDDVQREDLTGYWYFPSEHWKHPTDVFDYWYFDRDSVFIGTYAGFQQNGTFEIADRQIFIKANNNSQFELPFSYLEADTLWLSDSLCLIRWPEETLRTFITFPLLEIPTTDTLKQRGLYSTIYFFKDPAGRARLKLGDKITSYNDLLLFLSGHTSRQPRLVLMYLDQAISLPELDTLHKHLSLYGASDVALVGAFKDFQIQGIFEYELDLWERYYGNLWKKKSMPPPPPPPPNYQSHDAFLEDGGQRLSIESIDDIAGLNSLGTGKKYLISFSSQLSLKDYFTIKMKLYQIAKQRNIEFRTEIVYPDTLQRPH